MTTTTRTEPRGFVHSALLYHSERDYVDRVVPFVVDGLGLGQPVLVAVPKDNLAVLRDALGDAAAKATTADMTEVGRNPGRILGVFGAFAEKHPHRRT